MPPPPPPPCWLRTGAREIVLCIHCLLQAFLHTGIFRRQLETSLVRLCGVVKLLEEKLGKALSCIALGPIWLELHTLLSILKCLVVLLQRCVARRPVGEKDMVSRVVFDGLGEVHYGFLVVLGLEILVAKRLCLLSFLLVGHR